MPRVMSARIGEQTAKDSQINFQGDTGMARRTRKASCRRGWSSDAVQSLDCVSEFGYPLKIGGGPDSFSLYIDGKRDPARDL